jgi:hypothetical protein
MGIMGKNRTASELVGSALSQTSDVSPGERVFYGEAARMGGENAETGGGV